jgi:hypothetical protein
MKKELITYSLLSHIRENAKGNYSSLAELYFPLVKKGLAEYSFRNKNSIVQGKSLSEIQGIIIEIFGVDIPPAPLGFILNQISKEINDDTFIINNDDSFIINAFQFSEINEILDEEENRINILVHKYRIACDANLELFSESDLYNALISINDSVVLESSRQIQDLNPFAIKFIKDSYDNPELKILICDIYLGSLITNYFRFNIENKIADCQLLIDTNFYISLIDLNTYDSYLSCKSLFELCQNLGFTFSILFSTVEQIKVLLSNRIFNFSQKDLGFYRDADIFGACIRKNLTKTDLERIKDGLESELKRKGIEIVHEVQLKDIISQSKESDKYAELYSIRHNELSALNDTIAYYYVKKHRGDNISEFSDVKCWFLNNSFNRDYYLNKGMKLHDRHRISANELLTVLWLANPNQVNISSESITLSGLTSFIAKYKVKRNPSPAIVLDLRNRSKKLLEDGHIEEKDIFSLSIRMSEGFITREEAEAINEMSDESFINVLKSISRKQETVKEKIEEQDLKIDSLLSSSNQISQELAQQRLINSRNEYAERELLKYTIKVQNFGWKCIMGFTGLLVVSIIINLNIDFIPNWIFAIFNVIVYLIALLYDTRHNSRIFNAVKFVLLKESREVLLRIKKQKLLTEFDVKHTNESVQ